MQFTIATSHPQRATGNGRARFFGSSNTRLWVLQGVLAALFISAALPKLFLPIDESNQMGLPVLFLRFVGLCELAGGLGLILPGIFRIARGLTWLAAAGLAGIMAGATTVCIIDGAGIASAMPFAVGLICLVIIRGRIRQTTTAN